MNSTAPYERLFRYEAWANAAVFDSLREMTPAPERALRILMHVLAAERLWLARIGFETPPAAVWPEPSLAVCRHELEVLGARWLEYLEGMSAAELVRTVQYTNTRGEPWSNGVQDILLHVVLHSAYHRGQIASDLRGNGHTPPPTDFIHCVRLGFLD